MGIAEWDLIYAIIKLLQLSIYGDGVATCKVKELSSRTDSEALGKTAIVIVLQPWQDSPLLPPSCTLTAGNFTKLHPSLSPSLLVLGSLFRHRAVFVAPLTSNVMLGFSWIPNFPCCYEFGVLFSWHPKEKKVLYSRKEIDPVGETRKIFLNTKQSKKFELCSLQCGFYEKSKNHVLEILIVRLVKFLLGDSWLWSRFLCL